MSLARHRRHRTACGMGGLVAILLLAGHAAAAETDRDSEGIEFFRARIEPVLAAHCHACHSGRAANVEGGLRLDSPEALLRGGDSGPAVVPGKRDASILVQALRHEGGLAMPPDRPPLSAAVIADFEAWIERGAPMPAARSPLPVAPEHDAEARRHWAFQPVARPPLPVVDHAAWVLNPVDAFVLAKLEQQGWEPAPPAERSVWLRRVYFDLTGLPPAPEELDEFLADSSPDAEHRVVDRLLNSPRYGERWAQHWLDVVRYAETEGYEYDRHVPGAWRFRDYVIDSFNRDKPFDRFLVEQIAGDELDPGNLEFQAASIFHRLGPVRRNAGNPDIALSRNEVLTERTDILGAAFLGLTIGCARCHSHKLEPLSQRDYYCLQSYLAATDENNIVLASKADREQWERETQQINDRLQALKDQSKDASPAERERLAREIEELETRLPEPLPTIPATRNNWENRTPIHILRRGVWENKGEAVGPRPPAILVSDDLGELPPDVPNPRTRLAAWIASPDHPLTARVLANRLWQSHLGVGLVATANDFGTRGSPPSHPELLDWLATRLVDGGWQLKPIHRLVVLSNTYRQSDRSPHDRTYRLHDPENRWLWRFPRRRLSAEELRDAMLAVSGRLNLAAGGKSVMVPVDPDLVNLLYKPSQWQVVPRATEHDRRSIFLIAKRNLRLPFVEAFDAPGLLTSCGRRATSTHAPQALELLNGRLSNELAASFAGRLREESGGDRERIVARAFRLALGRMPTEAERRLALSSLAELPLEEFALAMFNLNDFLHTR